MFQCGLDCRFCIRSSHIGYSVQKWSHHFLQLLLWIRAQTRVIGKSGEQTFAALPMSMGVEWQSTVYFHGYHSSTITRLSSQHNNRKLFPIQFHNQNQVLSTFIAISSHLQYSKSKSIVVGRTRKSKFTLFPPLVVPSVAQFREQVSMLNVLILWRLSAVSKF